MDSNMEFELQCTDTETKPGLLLLKILDKCDTETLLHITEKHISTVLKYLAKVSERGSSAFPTKEEYQEFAIAKFFVDKCIDVIKRTSTPTVVNTQEEENCDTEDENMNYVQPMQLREKLPPLEAFHLLPMEKKKRISNFWKNVQHGDLYHAKVVVVTDIAYHLIIVNKYMNDERLIDLTINACMKKSYIKENLVVADIVRVSVCHFTEVNSVLRLVVTADPSMIKIKIENNILGKISETALPFPPIEAYKFRSLTQYIAAHCTDRDSKIMINTMKSLGIAPYKTYSLQPELNSNKDEMKRKERSKDSKNEKESIAVLKQAMISRDRGDITEALKFADKALKLNPKYDLAYAIRGDLFIKKADDQFSSLLVSAVSDFFSALKLNSHNYLALEHISNLMLKSTLEFLNDGAYNKARTTLETAIELHENKAAEILMKELDLHEEKWFMN